MATRLPRCTYCNAPGIGDPPLCRQHYADVHYDEPLAPDEPLDLDDLLGDLTSHPAFQALFAGAADYVVGRARQVVGNAQTWGHSGEWPPRPPEPPPPGPRFAYHSPPPRPPPPSPPPPPRGEDPRSVLGIPPGTKLTPKMVKAHHKALSLLLHPDQGGTKEAMQRLNLARDALLSQLGR